MPDQTTFEARLENAFERYLAAAPTTADPRAVAAAAAHAAPRTVGQPGVRRLTGLRGLRRPALVLLGILLIAAAAVVAGSIRQVVLPPEASPTPRPQATDLAPATYFGLFGPPFAASPIAGDFMVELADGRVLLIGNSWPTRTPQHLWDPVTNAVDPIGLLNGARDQPIAVRLHDGRILILGGDVAEGETTYSTAELYDPATNEFVAAGPMIGRGWAPKAVVLKDGRVLVLDGISVDDAQEPDPLLTTAELYDPQTNTFSATESMAIGRRGEMTLLDDGRVFVVGGRFPEPGMAEIYDPATETFSQVGPLPDAVPHPGGGTYWPEVAGHVALLPDGRLLIAGRACQESFSTLPGGNSEGWYPTAASIFDPTTDAFGATDPMPHCIEQAAALANGQILLRGFWHEDLAEVDWSGVYDPQTGTIRTIAPPPGGRYIDMLPLADGRILLRGPSGLRLSE